MPIVVNFYDEVIYVTSPTTEVTIQELYDAIRAAEDTPIGMNFGGTGEGQIIPDSGIFTLATGVETAISFRLNSNWYVEFWDGVTLGTVKDGNIVGGDSDRPVRAAPGSADTAYQLGAQYGVQIDDDLTSLKGLVIALDD